MKRQIGILATMTLVASIAIAQSTPAPTPAPATPLVTVSSSAMALELNGQYTVGSDTTETINLTKSCGLAGDQLLVPGIDLQGYYGGVACTPDLSALIAKTLIPPAALQFTFKGSAGVVRNTTTAAVSNHVSFGAGGCLTYNATAGGGAAVPLCIGYVRVPGFGKSSNGVVVSLGFGWVFGH